MFSDALYSFSAESIDKTDVNVGISEFYVEHVIIIVSKAKKKWTIPPKISTLTQYQSIRSKTFSMALKRLSFPRADKENGQIRQFSLTGRTQTIIETIST